MKTVLQVLIVFLLLVSTALAGGYYPVGNGYYTYQNDGWYYLRHVKPGYWYCGKWYPETVYYNRVYQIPQKKVITYSANWKTEIIKAAKERQDSELFVQALRESGLASPQQAVQAAAGVNSYVHGSQVYQQGYYQPFAQQGATLLGLKAYAPNIGQVDIQGTLNQLSRLAEQQMTAADNVSWAFGQRVGEVTAGQLELAKIQEAGRVAVALAQVSSPPRQVTTQFEARAGAGAGPSASASAVGAPPSPVQPQEGSSAGPPPPPNSNGGAMALIQAGELFKQACAKCHNPQDAKGKLDLSGFANWNEDQLRQYGPKIAERIISDDPEFQMPPPESGAKPLSFAEIRLVLSVLPLE